jgi:hypothetical protein
MRRWDRTHHRVGPPRGGERNRRLGYVLQLVSRAVPHGQGTGGIAQLGPCHISCHWTVTGNMIDTILLVSIWDTLTVRTRAGGGIPATCAGGPQQPGHSGICQGYVRDIPDMWPAALTWPPQGQQRYFRVCRCASLSRTLVRSI